MPGGDKNGTDGSEQSSGSKPSEEGTTEPDGDLQSPGMSTENQMKEGFPPQMPGQGQMPGMDPSIAQQMAPPQNMPPMNLPQQVQQMQYTVRKMTEGLVKEVQTLRKQIGFQQEAIKSLNTKVTETISLKNGLDLNGFKERAILPRTQETIPDMVSNVSVPNAKIYEKHRTTEDARHKISELDDMLSNSTQPYQ